MYQTMNVLQSSHCNRQIKYQGTITIVFPSSEHVFSLPFVLLLQMSIAKLGFETNFWDLLFAHEDMPVEHSSFFMRSLGWMISFLYDVAQSFRFCCKCFQGSNHGPRTRL